MTVQHDVPVSPAVTAGIDWASSEHAVAVVDEHGIQRQRRTVAHTKAGIGQLVAMLSRAGVTEVGIERGDGPLVEALIAAPFTVYVMRTHCTYRHRLTPLTPDTPATISLRMTVRARQDLVVARVAMANQLRAHLANVLPGAIGLFSEIDSAIGLAFLTRFPTQDKVDWLSPRRLETWLRSSPTRRPASSPRAARTWRLSRMSWNLRWRSPA